MNDKRLEIERKFLVNDSSYREMAYDRRTIEQGYLSRDPERTVRIRKIGDEAFITVKGKNSGIVRKEFEFPIPENDFRKMIELCLPPVIEKERFYVDFNGHVWEVDEFHGKLAPLVIAEIELGCCDEEFDIPPFVGKEVTSDPRYYNSMLGKK